MTRARCVVLALLALLATPAWASGGVIASYAPGASASAATGQSAAAQSAGATASAATGQSAAAQSAGATASAVTAQSATAQSAAPRGATSARAAPLAAHPPGTTPAGGGATNNAAGAGADFAPTDPASSDATATDPAASALGGGAESGAAGASGTGTDPAASAFGGGADSGAAAADPLAQNGFASVLCREPRLRQGLSEASQSNCRTSSFVAAAAPTGNYAFDVHIDNGLVPSLNTLIQDLFLTPVWTALVWLVHALIVALEWCYAIDLLDNSTMGTVARSLRSAQATVTQPWMVVVLAVASVLAVYQGLIRRRVAETLGEFVVMVAMIAAGLWVILDPSGTVGSLGRWANESSLGTLGAVTVGRPDHADQALARGMQDVFAAAIANPWCYLEFGDVSWCRDSSRLDPHLRAAAARIAAQERSVPGLGDSAALLDRAATNGDIFLALPANQVLRNSINDPESLLRVLCGSSDADRCRGPTAAQAEFRTSGSTWPRAGGLLLIAIGATGMIVLLAFIALRLLGAAVGSLFYLLLAPVAVLAPALGDGGRSVFRGWGTRLLGAVMAKLIYSVFLGVVLLVLRVLMALGSLGWWTQWLLITAFWWMVFQHRHQVLRYAALGHRETGTRGMTAASLTRRRLPRLPRVPRGLRRLPHGSTPRTRPGRTDRSRRPSPAQDRAPASAAGASELLAGQVGRTLEHDRADALATVGASRGASRRAEDDRKRLDRLRSEISAASAAGDTRRRASLQRRAAGLESRLADERAAVDEARALTGTARTGAEHGAGGPAADVERQRARAQLLDLQSSLPGARQRLAPDQQRRDYRALAGLAGLSPAAYARLPAGPQRAARLVIDRELDQRRRALGMHSDQDGRHAADSEQTGPSLPTSSARSPRPRPSPTGPAPSRGESIVLRRERQFERGRPVAASESREPRRPARRAR